MNRLLRRLAALATCAVFALSGAQSARAEDLSNPSGESSEAAILVSVRMEEETSGSTVIPTLHLSCPAGTTAAGLLAILQNYAYLDSYTPTNGVLAAVELEVDGEPLTLTGTDGWDLTINGQPVDRGSLPILSDGDELCWSFVSADSSAEEPAREVAASVASLWNDRYAEALTQATAWLKNNFDENFALISLGAAGVSVNYQNISRLIEMVEAGSFADSAALAKAILSATFCGMSAANIRGKNLLSDLSAYPDIAGDGPLAAALALIAVDSNEYPLPDGLNTRASLRSLLLEAQNEDGSFSAAEGEAGSALLTAAALTALSCYRQSDGVEAALENGLAYLSAAQNEDGSMSGGDDASTAFATSFAVAALCALGVPVDNPDFVREENLLEALLRYQTQSGGFCPEIGEPAEEEATAAAILALTAAKNNRNIFVLRSPLTAQPAESQEESGSETEPAAADESSISQQEETSPSPLPAIGVAAAALAALTGVGLFWARQTKGGRKK